MALLSTRSARGSPAGARRDVLAWLAAGRNGLERGRRELNAVRDWGCPHWTCPWRHQPRARAGGHLPQLEYPRKWPEYAHVVGPLMWEPPAADVQMPPGQEPLVLMAPSTAQDAEHRISGPRCAGWPRLRCGSLRPGTRDCRASAGGAVQRKGGRLALLLAHDAPVRRRRLSCRSRNAGTGFRPGRRRRLPIDRRHERERRSAGLGRSRGADPPAATRTALGPGGRRADPRRALDRRASSRDASWAAAHDSGRAAAELLEAVPSPAPSASRTSTVT